MHWKLGLVIVMLSATAMAQPELPDPTQLPEECPGLDPECEVECPPEVAAETDECQVQCVAGDCTLTCIDAEGQAIDCDAPCPQELQDQGIECASVVLPPDVEDPELPAFRLPNGSVQESSPAQEYEHELWVDGQFIRDQPADGFDLVSLRAWEVDHYEHGAGVAMRFELAGGTIAPAAEDYFVHGQVVVRDAEEGPANVTLWSSDGETWQSEHAVLAAYQSEQPDVVEGAVAGPSYHVVIILVPYEHLGAEVGDTLDGWSFETYSQFADVTVRTDIAPGGFYAAGQEVPEPDAEGNVGPGSLSSAQPAPEGLFLRGAGQHIDLEGDWASGVATLTISNPYEETTQFVALAYPSAADPYTDTSGWVAPGQSIQFQFAVDQRDEAYTLQWDVRSSIGGVASAELTLPALPPEPDPADEPLVVPVLRTDRIASPADIPLGEPPAPPAPTEEEPAEEESPLSLWLAVTAVAAALVVRRLK